MESDEAGGGHDPAGADDGLPLRRPRGAQGRLHPRPRLTRGSRLRPGRIGGEPPAPGVHLLREGGSGHHHTGGRLRQEDGGLVNRAECHLEMTISRNEEATMHYPHISATKLETLKNLLRKVRRTHGTGPIVLEVALKLNKMRTRTMPCC